MSSPILPTPSGSLPPDLEGGPILVAKEKKAREAEERRLAKFKERELKQALRDRRDLFRSIHQSRF
jgi:hypothetical protein